MDFNDTPEEAAFRAEVRAWLAKNAPAHEGARQEQRTSEDVTAGLEKARKWQALKSDAGYTCITWPEEYGGRGGTPLQAVIYAEEEAKYSVPRGYFEIGIGMAGPTLMAYASPEVNEQYLPRMRRGDDVWCQLFSEPSAGSDLAGLRTRAERDGDDWIVNGQKVWTSGAHFSDYGILVTRHDPTVPKHMGLTYFFVDMRSPGIEVSRIKQISGGSNFCEVFFNDVRIPDANRLGNPGDGWSVALTTLMNERLAVGDAPPPDADELVKFLKKLKTAGSSPLKNPAVRERLAEWYVQMQGLKFTKARTLTALSRGQTPGPEASITKVVSAQKLQDIASYAMELMDMGGILEYEETPELGMYLHAFLFSPGYRIAGGTDEILRNIIAERVLGLPPDIRVDKDKPFAQLPTGAK